MEGKPRNDRTSTLKTAIAAADPVLMRLSTTRQTLVLLAADMTYDHAGVMTLHDVRWVRARGGVHNLFSRLREPGAGRAAEIRVRRQGTRVHALIPDDTPVSADARPATFAMRNIPVVRYALYRRSSARRLLLAGCNQTGVVKPVPLPLKLARGLKRAVVNALTAKLA